jgi:ssDNA-binding Zn-finger/Zn-ribbon topoisomerase 1
MDDGFDLWDSQNQDCWFHAVIEQGKYCSPTKAAKRNANVDSVPKQQNSVNSTAPFCKSCNIQMVVKSNRTTGDQFYGCPNYSVKRCKSVPLAGQTTTSATRQNDFSPNWSTWCRKYTSYPSDLMEAEYEAYAADIGDR